MQIFFNSQVWRGPSRRFLSPIVIRQSLLKFPPIQNPPFPSPPPLHESSLQHFKLQFIPHEFASAQNRFVVQSVCKKYQVF